MADYNINAVTRRVVYTGSAGLGPYAFSFEVLVNTDVAVYFNSTLLTFTTDYTVLINANGTGSITIVTGTNVPTTPDSGDQITVVGDRAIERTTDFVTAGDLRASSLNEQLDALTIFDQQLAESADRAIKAPVTDPTSINMTLPARADRANAFLLFDADGDPSVQAAGSAGTPTSITRQQFSGDGSTVVFTLASDPQALGNSLSIYISGVYQQRATYTVSGTALTFSAAPPVGTNNIEVVNYTVTDIGSTDASLVTYTASGTGVVERTVQSVLRDTVSVTDFGAVGDGVTDDTTALQAFIDHLKSNSLMGYMPSGTYKVTDELDLFSSTTGVSWGIAGESWLETVIMCHFSGYNKAVLKGWTAASLAAGTRAAAPVLERIRVEYDGTDSVQNPIGFDFRGAGNGRFKELSVQGNNNTQFRYTSASNSDCDNLVLYNGGRNFPRKDADAVTFAITAGATTLVSSAGHFVAADVGEVLMLVSATHTELYTIASYTNTTTVEVIAVSNRAHTVSTGTWADNQFSIAATGTTLTANGSTPVFVAADVGLNIYIDKAGADGGMHRCEIVSYTNAYTVEVDIAAVTTVTASEIAVPAGAFDLDDNFADYGGVTNDLGYKNVQIETFKGVGAVVRGQTRANFNQWKIHGDSTPTYAAHSTYHMWTERSDCIFAAMTIESKCVNKDRTAISVRNVDGILKIPQLDCILPENSRTLIERANTSQDVIAIGPVNVLNSASSASFAAMFSNEVADTPRIQTGPVACLGRPIGEYPAQLGQAAIHLGATTAANLLDAFEQNIAWTPVIAGSSGSPSDTVCVGTYSRIGNLVYYEGYGININTTPMTAGANIHITGLPYTSKNTASTQFYTGDLTSSELTYTGEAAVVVGDNLNYLRIRINATGATDSYLTVAAMADDTCDLRFSGWYPIASGTAIA